MQLRSRIEIAIACSGLRVAVSSCSLVSVRSMGTSSFMTSQSRERMWPLYSCLGVSCFLLNLVSRTQDGTRGPFHVHECRLGSNRPFLGLGYVVLWNAATERLFDLDILRRVGGAGEERSLLAVLVEASTAFVAQCREGSSCVGCFVTQPCLPFVSPSWRISRRL